MARVLVVGAGAIGQWLGARLVAAGHEVTAWTTARHVAALQQLVITGETRFEGRLAAVNRRPAGQFDHVVLTAKAHQTAALAGEAALCLAPGGTFTTLQNGFGNGPKVAAVVPAGQVAVALTSHGVTLQQPGRLVHAGTGPTRIGALPGQDEDAARAASALLADAGLAPEWCDDVRPHVWLKGLVNHAVNPLAAVAGRTNGEMLQPPDRAAWEGLVHEGWSLSRAAGIALPGVATEQDLQGVVRGTLERTAINRCSMLQDVLARRPTEVEQISGFLVRLGRRLGYPFFASEDAYHALLALEAGYLGEAAQLQRVREELRWPAEA